MVGKAGQVAALVLEPEVHQHAGVRAGRRLLDVLRRAARPAGRTPRGDRARRSRWRSGAWGRMLREGSSALCARASPGSSPLSDGASSPRAGLGAWRRARGLRAPASAGRRSAGSARPRGRAPSRRRRWRRSAAPRRGRAPGGAGRGAVGDQQGEAAGGLGSRSAGALDRRLAIERVERVALDERAVKDGEDLGAADQVEHRRPCRRSRPSAPSWPSWRRIAARHLGEPVAALLVDVVHGTGRRVGAHPRRLLGDLAPDRALVGARSSPAGDAAARAWRGLRAAQARVGGLRGRVERLAVAASPPSGRPRRSSPAPAAWRRRRRAPRRRRCGSAARRAPPRPRRGGRAVAVGFSTVRSLTEAPPVELADRGSRRSTAWRTAWYSEPRLRGEDREDGQRAGDVGLAEAERLGEEAGDRVDGGLSVHVRLVAAAGVESDGRLLRIRFDRPLRQLAAAHRTPARERLRLADAEPELRGRVAPAGAAGRAVDGRALEPLRSSLELDDDAVGQPAASEADVLGPGEQDLVGLRAVGAFGPVADADLVVVGRGSSGRRSRRRRGRGRGTGCPSGPLVIRNGAQPVSVSLPRRIVARQVGAGRSPSSSASVRFLDEIVEISHGRSAIRF